MKLRGVFLGVVMMSGSAYAAVPLLVDAPEASLARVEREEAVVRSRGVRVNMNALRSPANRELELALFDGRRVGIVRESLEFVPDGFVWVGRIVGQERSLVTLSVVEDVVSGNITTEEREVYQLRYVGNALHAVRQINPAAFPDELEPLVVEPEAETKQEAPDFQAMADTGSTIDVMVAYTAAARNGAGGATAMSSLINLMISETNTSYSNSGINPRVRRVHAVEVSYTESGNLSTDLSRLRSTTDGHMDNVHSLRNTYKADLVGLITESGSACGVGYLMTTVSTSFASNGFSVTKRSCATGNYSFGHELGHNMGAHHDSYVTTSSGAYTYSYGYVYLAGRWRTIMAYNNRCADAGTSCTRIQYWSNPNRFYNGVATGTSTADNARTLNNTAYTVANFRASQ
jgi:peptidyl-Asp metalloendopeptidase